MKTLRALAVEATYQGIISEFDLIFQRKEKSSNRSIQVVDGFVLVKMAHPPPPEKKAKVEGVEAEIGEYQLTKEERDKALKELRKKLDHYLIGPFSVERQQFVDCFVRSYDEYSPVSDFDQNLCLALFNCLLDKEVKSFNLTGDKSIHLFQQIHPAQLLPIISQRCPNLQVLNLSFGYGWASHLSFSSKFCPLLKTFKHLTRLTFEWQHNETADSTEVFLEFFTLLGESFPKLVHLQLSGKIPFGLEQLLALVLGKRRSLLPRQLLDQLRDDASSVAHLQFPLSSLTSICSTLQQLKLFLSNNPMDHLIAFILRHFPNLQKCYTASTSQALCLLHQHQQRPNGIPAISQSSSVELGLIEWTINAPFTGISLF